MPSLTLPRWMARAIRPFPGGRHPAHHRSPGGFKPRLETLEELRLPSTIVDLGALVGFSASVNHYGQAVVGRYLYSDGTLTDLGTLPGGTYSVATGINDSGQVSGFGNTDVGNPEIHAYRHSDGKMTDLGSLGGGESFGYAINNFGVVVGTSRLYDQRGPYHAFLDDGTAMMDLGTLGGRYSRATGINDAGQVVGFSHFDESYTFHAFLWDAMAGMQDLGTLGGAASAANAINAYGQVAGFSDVADGIYHAFLYGDGTMLDLGTLLDCGWSAGRALNNLGQVVGESVCLIGHGVIQHAFLYSDGAMTDLNDFLPPDSGWVLTSAYGINDHGQVVGFGTFAGRAHAFLLTLDPGPTPAPRHGAFDVSALGADAVGVAPSVITPEGPQGNHGATPSLEAGRVDSYFADLPRPAVPLRLSAKGTTPADLDPEALFAIPLW